MVSPSDIGNWIEDRWDGFKTDVNRVYDTTDEAVRTGNATANLTRRDFGKLAALGVAGAGVDYVEDGDLDSVDVAATAGGAVWQEAAKRVPQVNYQIRSPIVFGGGNETEATPTPTPTPEEPTPTPTEEGTPTPTPTEQNTDAGTPTSTPTTTPTPELSYDSISDALLDQDEGVMNGFKGYSLTALDSQLEGVGLEDAVEQTSEYEDEVREAIEGSEYFTDEGIFRLGEYRVTDENPGGLGVDFGDDLDATDEIDQYFEELEENDELEDQVFGYIESLEEY